MPCTLTGNADAWVSYYRSLTDSYLFPNEFVVRAFLGNYPRLAMRRDYAGAKVCDVSCGDGRNLVLLNRLGLDLYATEISQEICDITRQKLLNHNDRISADIRPGSNTSLPFDDRFFDYMLSWNACYYMASETVPIARHIDEYARVLKPGGYLVVSVPTPDCFTLQGAEELGNDLVQINTTSKWNMLNGMIYYRFHSLKHIINIFGTRFDNFQMAATTADCFGITLAYFMFVCQKPR